MYVCTVCFIGKCVCVNKCFRNVHCVLLSGPNLSLSLDQWLSLGDPRTAHSEVMKDDGENEKNIWYSKNILYSKVKNIWYSKEYMIC